jgi:hypothetical protein
MENISQPTAEFIRDADWVGFPGGELEGKRPKVMCPACRERIGQAMAARRTPAGQQAAGGASRALCFQCYRAEIDRDRALKAAGELNTASVERFQTALPFEPVNRPRLDMLKVERLQATAQTTTQHGIVRFEDRRRRAQIAARHALQTIAAGLATRKATPADRAREIAYAIHAAELQLPDSWLPFVVSR